MRDEVAWVHNKFFGKDNLYVGCGVDYTSSTNGVRWVNLDMNPDNHPDLVWDVNNLPLPFKDDEFDCIFTCHTLEHLERNRFVEFAAEAHRILKNGGRLIGITPYGSNDVAMGMPQHRMTFYEVTWQGLDVRVYDKERKSFGSGDDELLPFRKWDLEVLFVIPYPEFQKDPELAWKAKHLRNIIQDMHAVMRVVK